MNKISESKVRMEFRGGIVELIRKKVNTEDHVVLRVSRWDGHGGAENTVEICLAKDDLASILTEMEFFYD